MLKRRCVSWWIWVVNPLIKYPKETMPTHVKCDLTVVNSNGWKFPEFQNVMYVAKCYGWPIDFSVNQTRIPSRRDALRS